MFMAVRWEPYLSKVKLISHCVLISSSPQDSNDSNSCFQDMHLDIVQSQHVENSGHTDRRRRRRISGHYRKEIWSLSQPCSLSHPSHSFLHHHPPFPPSWGLSTPLVMTMLQTALLSLGALLEPRCNSAKKASAWGREWSFLEEIDSVWSSAAPRHTLALLRLRHPAGEGAEVARRGCGGLWQKKTLQKNLSIPASHTCQLQSNTVLKLYKAS